MSTWRTTLRGLLAALLLGAHVPVFPQSRAGDTLEYQVKTSYLYNFLQFIKWPDTAFADGANFDLCVAGAERFGSALDALAGERVRGREIVVHRLDAGASTAHCHLLFIAAVPGAPPASPPSRRGLLTIGETPGFLQRGGVINLINVGGHVRFEINQNAARDADLIISSRLLALAVR